MAVTASFEDVQLLQGAPLHRSALYRGQYYAIMLKLMCHNTEHPPPVSVTIGDFMNNSYVMENFKWNAS